MSKTLATTVALVLMSSGCAAQWHFTPEQKTLSWALGKAGAIGTYDMVGEEEGDNPSSATVHGGEGSEGLYTFLREISEPILNRVLQIVGAGSAVGNCPVEEE